MTHEQVKIVDRCKQMLKTVFGSQACRIMFRVLPQKPDVKADVTYIDVGTASSQQQPRETVVDLQ